MIYEKYAEQFAALVYDPEKSWEYDNAVYDINLEFRMELEQVYETVIIPLEEKVIWGEAWERGHAEGYSKVEEIYVELAKVALEIHCEELYSAFSPDMWEELDIDFSVDVED